MLQLSVRVTIVMVDFSRNKLFLHGPWFARPIDIQIAFNSNPLSDFSNLVPDAYLRVPPFTVVLALSRAASEANAGNNATKTPAASPIF